MTTAFAETQEFQLNIRNREAPWWKRRLAETDALLPELEMLNRDKAGDIGPKLRKAIIAVAAEFGEKLDPRAGQVREPQKALDYVFMLQDRLFGNDDEEIVQS